MSILKQLTARGLAKPSNPGRPTEAFWREALDGYAEWRREVPTWRDEEVYYPDYGPWYRLTEAGESERERRAKQTK